MQTFHNELFPFICSNPSCEKEYKYHDLFLIASQWGYINLANREYSIIGLTCPSCNTTTIKKCSPDSISSETLEFLGSKFIPFLNGGIDGLIYDEDENLYRVPNQITKVFENNTYPKWFEDRAIYSVAEDDFARIIAYENKYQKMVLPRIISVSSIYNKAEEFLLHCKEKHPSMYGFEFTGHPESMYDIFIRIAKNNYLTTGSESSISEDEYKDLNVTYAIAIDYPQGLLEKIPVILNEYLQKRDRFDFQRSNKKSFLDKYIMEFCYAKGYYRSKQYFNDKGYYEDIFGKQVKNIRWPIDQSKDDEILSYTDIMKRWDKDLTILKHLIACGDLPAYNFNGVWLDLTKPEVQDIDLHPKNFIFLESEVEELQIRKSWLTSDKSGKNNGKNSGLVIDGEYKKKRETAIKDNSKEEQEILQEKRIEIENCETGHTYESLFGEYLRKSSHITIQDKWIRSDHQIKNLIRLCRLIEKTGRAEKIHLVTWFADETQKQETEKAFRVLHKSLIKYGIEFTYEFRDTYHDRSIRTDDGWIIDLGKGLDIYKPPGSWYKVDAEDFERRPCFQTTINIKKMRKQIAN